jgi:hypothetical protein
VSTLDPNAKYANTGSASNVGMGTITTGTTGGLFGPLSPQPLLPQPQQAPWYPAAHEKTMPVEPLDLAPFLIRWYSSGHRCYHYQTAESEAEALEWVRENLMQDTDVAQVLVMGLMHRWQREWKKGEK